MLGVGSYSRVYEKKIQHRRITEMSRRSPMPSIRDSSADIDTGTSAPNLLKLSRSGTAIFRTQKMERRRNHWIRSLCPRQRKIFYQGILPQEVSDLLRQKICSLQNKVASVRWNAFAKTLTDKDRSSAGSTIIQSP